MSEPTGRLDHPGRRRTLSGKVVDSDYVCLPTWLEIVAPQPKIAPKPHSYVPPVDTGLRIVEHPFRGVNRAAKRTKMKKMGLLGGYTKQMHLDMGEAWAANIEAHRAMARNNAAARLARKYQRVAAA